MKATARAHSNIALVKYWGKRSAALNLPTNGSLSLTLDRMHTTTTLEWSESLASDACTLNGEAAQGEAARKITDFLDLVRGVAGLNHRAIVQSFNNFPTAAGLASSASGFAALALAATKAAGVELGPRELSILARQGSGSASRSIFGGFAEWKRGEREDGLDSYAEPLPSRGLEDLSMIVTVLVPGPKPISSRNGMNQTTLTSPMYPAWLQTVQADIDGARGAIATGNFEDLGKIAEANCLKMHATMITTKPPILYWQPATVGLMHKVAAMRSEGLPCYFTIDAGPNVKVLCRAKDADAIERELAECAGVKETYRCQSGPGAYLL